MTGLPPSSLPKGDGMEVVDELRRCLYCCPRELCTSRCQLMVLLADGYFVSTM